MNHIKRIVRHTIGFAVIFIFLLTIFSPARQVQALGTVFVSEDGSGTTCSQAEPCSLADGLLQVDTGGTLYAAAGTYMVDSGDQVVLLQRTIDFLGGWDGATSGPIVRDPERYKSILDADNVQRRRVMTITGGADVQPLVNGWTIRNGNAALPAVIPECFAHAYDSLGCGGGIYVYDAQPTISNNIIEDNAALIQFDSVDANASGGGIYVDKSAGTIISGNIIRNNNSQIGGEGWGAGIFIHKSGGMTEIFDNEIYENEDSVNDDGDNHFGGGIMIYENDGLIQIHDNYIHDNDPLDQSVYGAAIGLQYSDANVIIEDNIITGNFGDNAIALSFSAATIQRNVIINPGADDGIALGATHSVSIDPHTALVYNNFIAGHEFANIRAGASDPGFLDAQIIHNTLADAQYGLYLEYKATLTFDRGIISGHSVIGVYTPVSPDISLTLSNTLFHDNESDGDTGANPLDGDPHFSNPAGYDYHIQWDSAAINRVTDGGIDEDIDGDPRPTGQGSTPYDVGADEYICNLFLPLIVRP